MAFFQWRKFNFFDLTKVQLSRKSVELHPPHKCSSRMLKAAASPASSALTTPSPVWSVVAAGELMETKMFDLT